MAYIFNFLFFNAFLLASITPFIPKSSIYLLRAFHEASDITITESTKGELYYYKDLKKISIFKESLDQKFKVKFINKDLLLIERNLKNTLLFDLRKDNEIYLYNLKTKKLEPLPKGSSVEVHQDGHISFLNQYSKKINIYSTTLKKLTNRISYNHHVTHYKPKVRVTASGEVFYTDLNQQKKEILYFIKRKQKTTIIQGQNKEAKISICLDKNDTLYYSVTNSKLSRITTIDRKNIYQTPNSIQANIKCYKNGLYFVQSNDEQSSYSLKKINLKNLSIQNLHSSSEYISIIKNLEFVFFETNGGYYKIL